MGEDRAGLDLVASGTASAGPDRAQPRRTFYADPVAWLITEAVDAALYAAGPAVRDAGPAVGVLSASEHCTRHTMRQVHAGSRDGRVSPLRFAGANPGSIAGVVCIVFGFRGPSLALSMPPGPARAVAGQVALSWLDSGGCRYVVLNEHEITPDGVHVARCDVVCRRGTGPC